MRTIRHVILHRFVEAMFWIWPPTANPPTWALNLTGKAVDILEADHRHYA